MSLKVENLKQQLAQLEQEIAYLNQESLRIHHLSIQHNSELELIQNKINRKLAKINPAKYAKCEKCSNWCCRKKLVSTFEVVERKVCESCFKATHYYR